MRDVILINLNFEGWSFAMTLPFWILACVLGWRSAARWSATVLRACTMRPRTLVTNNEKCPVQVAPELASRRSMADLRRLDHSHVEDDIGPDR